MSQKRLPSPNVRYLYYRYMNKLEKEVNVRLGFGLFGAGCVAALVGLVVFAYSLTLEAQSEAYYTWVQPAYALGLLALPLALLGIVILLPPDRKFMGVSALGLLVAIGATAGFAWIYPDAWHRAGSDATLQVVGPYAAGVGAIALGVAASMREHAPELIETVTRIHQPDAESDDASSGADASAAGAAAAGAGSASAGASSSGGESASTSGASDSGAASASGADSSAASGDGGVDVADVPDQTAVVDTGDDADDVAETAVLDESGPAGTGRGPITLVINGRRYSFSDGDTFGRRDEPWLDDLVASADGHEEIPYVSGEHLEFSVEDDGIYATDLSRNGTKINGKDVSGETARISDGDTLVLADRAKVRVELDR